MVLTAMTLLLLDITMSLDGFVAGPNQTLEQPLGEGGDQLHQWLFGLASFRAQHRLSGGEENADSKAYDWQSGAGAVVMGRRMFSGGAGPWEDDPNAAGWWGDEPPFHVPVFVLTKHPRETVELQGGTSFTFVTDGIESALEQARGAAGARPVQLAGGANVVQQYLHAGLVDELRVHLAPVFLGGGVRLFGDRGPGLELLEVIDSPSATHLRYRVAFGEPLPSAVP
jgi:dihydrofolate reductase